MAYLTNYTYKKLCLNIDIKEEVNLNTFLEHIYNDPKVYYFFNKLDLKYLFNMKNILKNEVDYKINHFRHIHTKKDTNSYVFEKTEKLKYHLDADCKLLKKDYQNYTVPSDINKAGQEAVATYRNWFKENNFKERFENGELDKSAILFRYNAKFPKLLAVPVLNNNFELVKTLDNSGNIYVDEQFDYQDFLKSIEDCVTLRETMIQSHVMRVLSKHDYLVNRSDDEIREKMTMLFSAEFTNNYGMDNIRKFLKDFRVLKFKVMQNLINYFKWSHKYHNHSFDKITLEDFGLECCELCKENQSKK